MNPSPSVPTHRCRYLGLTVAAALLTVSASACGAGSSTEPSPTSTPDPGVAPHHVAWNSFQGVQVPTSRIDGPHQVQATGSAVGYTRTPQGAILAIEQGQVRVTLAGDAQWPAVVTTTVAPGPGRDAFATTRVFAKVTGAVTPTQALTFAGYKFTAWTPDRADAEVVTRDPRGILTTQPATAIWRGNDWKLLLHDPADPADTPALRTVASLTGYIAFGPGGAR